MWDSVDVVLRQDEAFGPERIDYDLWMTTLDFPMIMISGDDQAVVPNRSAAEAYLVEVERAVRRDGVRAFRTRILSHIQPTPDMSIISSMRDLLNRDGGVLATSIMTFTLKKIGGEWKITQLFFDDSIYDLKVSDAMWALRLGQRQRQHSH